MLSPRSRRRLAAAFDCAGQLRLVPYARSPRLNEPAGARGKRPRVRGRARRGSCARVHLGTSGCVEAPGGAWRRILVERPTPRRVLGTPARFASMQGTCLFSCRAV